VTDALIRLLGPIRKIYDESEEWQEVTRLAYPDPNAKKDVSKKKKEKKYVPPPPGKGKNVSTDPQPAPVVLTDEKDIKPLDGKEKSLAISVANS